jgi:hypothetical protein
MRVDVAAAWLTIHLYKGPLPTGGASEHFPKPFEIAAQLVTGLGCGQLETRHSRFSRFLSEPEA